MSSWNQLWKFQVNEINFGLIYLYMQKRIDIQNNIATIKPFFLSIICIFDIKIKFSKDHQKCFLFYQESSFVKIFKSLYFLLIIYTFVLLFFYSWQLLILKKKFIDDKY